MTIQSKAATKKYREQLFMREGDEDIALSQHMLAKELVQINQAYEKAIEGPRKERNRAIEDAEKRHVARVEQIRLFYSVRK